MTVVEEDVVEVDPGEGGVEAGEGMVGGVLVLAEDPEGLGE